MASREANYTRRINSELAMSDSELKATGGELHQSAIDAADANAMDLGELVGGLVGSADVQLEKNAKEMEKPLLKFSDAVSGTLTDNYRDMESTGYLPQVFYSDVQNDLSNPDQIHTLLTRLSGEQTAPCLPVYDDFGRLTNVCTGPLVPPSPLPPPPNAPVSPVVAPVSPDCVLVDDNLPGVAPRLVCTKPDEGNPGGPTTPGTVEPEPPGGSCPAPEPPQFVCPAPVIVMPPVPVPNPANLQPGEPSPGTDEPIDEPSCPDVPDVNVNNVVNVPPIQFPDPVQEPKFKFRTLDQGPPGDVVLKWDTDEACGVADDLVDSWNRVVNATAGTVQDVADYLSVPFGRFISNKLGIAQTTAGPVVNLAFSLFADVKDDSREAFEVRATAAQFSQVRIMQSWVAQQFGGNAAAAMAPAALAAGMVGLAADLPFNFGYFVQPLVYESQFMFPVYLPEQPAIDALFLGDRITQEQHECYTKAQGNLPHLHGMAAEEKRERPSANEWIDTWRRGKIDIDRLYRELRKLGWLDQSEAARKVDLSEAIPTFGDVIRFMVRDTENADAVAAGQLDKGFENNFTGQLLQWANANGVSPDLARRYWRAHWQWISNTQGYEMIHRLRPGRVPEELETTADTIRKVLEINDVAPAFIDRLIAISYRPLTRVDVRRAYEIGVLNRDDVLNAYLDLGYDTKNAETLTSYVEKDIRRKKDRAVHVWSLSAVASAYQAGTVDRAFAYSKAIVYLESDDAVNAFLFDVDNKRLSDQRKRCLAAVKKKYMTGEFSELQGQDAVSDVVVDRDVAVSIVNEWECERSARRKEVAAGQLCKWLGQGLIDMPTYLTRLGNLGYGEDDAKRMLASCSQDIFEKEKKAAIASARQSLQQYQKRQAEIKAAIKDYEKKLKELQDQYGQCQPNGTHN